MIDYKTRATQLGLTYRQADHWARAGLLGPMPMTEDWPRRRVMTAEQDRALVCIAWLHDLHGYPLDQAGWLATLARDLPPGETLTVNLCELLTPTMGAGAEMPATGSVLWLRYDHDSAEADLLSEDRR